MNYSFKILFIGDSGSGKTSIINVSNNSDFVNLFTSTIGIDFCNLNIERKGESYELKLWDTGGHERFKFLIKSYYRNITALVIVYDITCIKSFLSIDTIINEYYKETGNKNTPILILGNKVDLNRQREVSHEMARAMASKYNCLFMECSAKSHFNIEQIYFNLIDYINEKIKSNQLDTTPKYGIKSLKRRGSITEFSIEDTGTLNQKTCCNIL